LRMRTISMRSLRTLIKKQKDDYLRQVCKNTQKMITFADASHKIKKNEALQDNRGMG